jgi:hypothetical protein
VKEDSVGTTLAAPAPKVPRLDWHNNIVHGELEKHVALVSPKLVAIVTTPAAKARYAPALDAPDAAGHIRIVDSPAALTLDGVGVVAIIAEGLGPARLLNMQLTAPKDAGLPVVYCIPDRRLASQPPGWENTGLSYGGMFKIAATYLTTLKSRGSYVEFGVFDGHSIVLAFHALQNVCDTFYAFDSFRGIGGTLDSETTHFKDGQYYANPETLAYNLRFTGVDASRVKPVPGFFSDTIEGRHPSEFGISTASIVHIDTDVFEPALMALEFISPALPQGALLLFDDYDQLDASNHKGERRAVRAWLEAHPEFEIEPYRVYGAVCRSFLVHRSA